MIVLLGAVSREPLSYRGHVLLHDGDPHEVNYLLPTVRMIAFPSWNAERISAHLGRPVMLLRDHPSLASVRWPLDRRHFRAQGK